MSSSSSALSSLLSSGSSASSSSLDISSLLSAATGASSTGIDVSAAVDAAIYAARAPERQWQSQQSTLQAQVNALSAVQTAAVTLSSDLTTLQDPLGALASRAVSSSDTSVVTATAAGGTSVGTHSISVTQLATPATWYSPVVAGSGSSLGSSNLTITQAGGTQTTFTLGVSGTDSFSALVQTINNANLGVRASVVQDAGGARLALVGTQTGATAGFTVSNGGVAVTAWQSATVKNASAGLVASRLQVSDGSSSATIEIHAGDSLSSVAQQINALGLSLTANVVSDSSGSHLAVTSTVGQPITVSEDPTLTLTQATEAQDAQLTVDGVPVASASNSVNGAIPGLTLNLTGTTLPGSSVSLGVTADTNQISTALSQFVTHYNALASQISSQFAFNSGTGAQGALGSDSTLRSLQSALLGVASFAVPGASAGAVHTLSDLGITMGDDGSLSLNSSALSQAITAHADAVQNFFQAAGQSGFASSTSAQLKAFSAPSSGLLAVDIQNLTQQYKGLQTSVDDFESGYIASQKTLLTSMYSKAEIALQSLPATLKQIQAELNNNSGN